MSEKVYKKLVAEYRRKDRLYPDRGFSVRPWEQSLRESIMNEIEAGLARGAVKSLLTSLPRPLPILSVGVVDAGRVEEDGRAGASLPPCHRMRKTASSAAAARTNMALTNVLFMGLTSALSVATTAARAIE